MAEDAFDVADFPPTPVLAGLGPELEARLLGPLEEDGAIEVVERCLSAEHLRVAATGYRAEAAILSTELHGLTRGLLEQLRLPRVLLTADADPERWHNQHRLLALPHTATPDQVRDALRRVLRNGEVPRPAAPAPHIGLSSIAGDGLGPTAGSRGQLVLVTKLFGAAGATTLATSLTVLLDRSPHRAVLCDLDPGAAAFAYTDADPTRNVYQVAYAAPATAEAWERTLATDLQPLCTGSAATLLAGVPRPEQRHVLVPGLVRQILDELRQRFAWTVVDLRLDHIFAGEPEGPLLRTVLDEADLILLVAATDLVRLHHTRQARKLLRPYRDRLRLVFNRHDARHHDGPGKIAYELGDQPLVTIPYDYEAYARAIESQQPVALQRRGPAARALGALADRLAQPVASAPAPRPSGPRPGWWRRQGPPVARARVSAGTGAVR